MRKSPLRILIVSLNFHPEEISTGKYSTEMALHLAQDGFQVRVITAPPYYPAWRVPEPYRWWRYASDAVGEVEIHRCPLWVPRRVTGSSRILHLSSFAISSAPIILTHARWRPHWVFLVAPTIMAAPMVLSVAKLSGASTWLHVQDFELDAAFGLGMLGGALSYRMGRAVEGALLRRFDRVSTISLRMRDRLLAAGVSATRASVLLNWVDTDEIFPIRDDNSMRAEFGLGTEDTVALYAGNMGRKQGLDLVVGAARALSKRPGLMFLLCGEGVDRARLEESCRGLGNVRFLGLQPRSRLNALLNTADIHLLPQEGGAADAVMPSKLTGMLASGQPVVATAAEGTELATVARQAGLVVPPGDVPAFAGAIERLAANPRERLELGTQGRAYAMANLSRSVILSRFSAELRQAESSRRQGSRAS